MRLTRQLPVYSPIRVGSLVAGVAAAAGRGDPLRILSRRLESHFGALDVRLLDSGTSALRLAIEAVLRQSDRKVVGLPAYCCYDVATAAIGAGAAIRLYDVDPATLGPDWPSLGRVLQEGCAGVVAVHQYGLPTDTSRMGSLAAASGAILIDDAAQGIGGLHAGKPLGSAGSLGIVSFGRGKGLTGGGGGALLVNDEVGLELLSTTFGELPPGAAGWGEVARLGAQWFLGRPGLYAVPAALPWLGLGETRYRVPWPVGGMARGAAAAALANWDASLKEAGARRSAAETIRAHLAGSEFQAIAPAACNLASELRLPVLVRPERRRETEERLAHLGIAPGYPHQLGEIEPVSEVLVAARRQPGAARLAGGLLTLPLHTKARPEDTLAGLTA